MRLLSLSNWQDVDSEEIRYSRIRTLKGLPIYESKLLFPRNQLCTWAISDPQGPWRRERPLARRFPSLRNDCGFRCGSAKWSGHPLPDTCGGKETRKIERSETNGGKNGRINCRRTTKEERRKCGRLGKCRVIVGQLWAEKCPSLSR